MQQYALVIFKGATNTLPARMQVKLYGEKPVTVSYCAALGPNTDTKDWIVYAVEQAIKSRRVPARVKPETYGVLPNSDRVVGLDYTG